MSAEGKSKMEWGVFVPTAVAVLVGMVAFSFLDRFVLSKIGNHLENLLNGNEE